MKNDEHCVCELGGISVPNNWPLINAAVKKLLDLVEVTATENTSERMQEQTAHTTEDSVCVREVIHVACSKDLIQVFHVGARAPKAD